MQTTLDIEDPEQLRGYLCGSPLFHGKEEIKTRVLAGGVSCRTVLVEADGTAPLVLKQALKKLRVKADWFSDPMRIHREALGLRWLQLLKPSGAVPEFLGEDFDHHVLVMSAVATPHAN